MCALLAIDVRSVCCVVGLLTAIGGTELLAQPRTKPRSAPWEIEPTEETKRRVEHGEFFSAGNPQIVISARQGERILMKFDRPPLSLQLNDPGKVAIRLSGSRQAVVHGLTKGITSLTVHYPASIPGDEHDAIRYLIRVHID